MHSHYNRPDVLSQTCSADHNIVVYSSLPDYLSSEPIIKETLSHSYGENQRAFFADSLMKVNWPPLYNMDTCEEQFDFFRQP